MKGVILLVIMALVNACTVNKGMEFTDYEKNKIAEYEASSSYKNLANLFDSINIRISKDQKIYMSVFPSYIESKHYSSMVYKNSESLMYNAIIFTWSINNTGRLKELLSIQKSNHADLENKKCLSLIRVFSENELEQLIMTWDRLKEFEDTLSKCSSDKKFTEYFYIFLYKYLLQKNVPEHEVDKRYRDFVISHPYLPKSLLEMRY